MFQHVNTCTAIVNKTYSERQTQLHLDIFKNYDKNVRPIRNTSAPLQVSIHAYLTHVVSVAFDTMMIHI